VGAERRQKKNQRCEYWGASKGDEIVGGWSKPDDTGLDVGQAHTVEKGKMKAPPNSKKKKKTAQTPHSPEKYQGRKGGPQQKGGGDGSGG